MGSPEVIDRETRYTRTWVSNSGNGPSYRIETLRCPFCDTPRADMAGKRLADHLENECQEAPR